MGNLCSQTQTEDANFERGDPFKYVYGEDDKEAKIHHHDAILSRVKQVQHNLLECEHKLKDSQKLYKDPYMRTDPINLKSLQQKNVQIKCTYQRPYVFLDNTHQENLRGRKYKIFDQAGCRPSQIIVNDEVLQYFGIFLCFLADNQSLIKQIIVTDPNTYGINVLQMNVFGKKQYIYIDDYMLCYNKKPLFSQPINMVYMWPCLIQNAWLKVKGSSSSKKIQKNTPEQVFEAFLSYPLKRYILEEDHDEQNNALIRQNLYHQQKGKGYGLTTKKEPKYKIGLSGRKHFYLLCSFDYKGRKLFYLRNPCGQFEFRGNYRQPTPEMIEKIKEKTNEVRVTDGNFILDQQQLLEQMQSFFVFHYTKSSGFVSEQTITLEDKEDCYILTQFKTGGHVSISWNQMSTNKINEVKYDPITYQVINLSNNTLVSGLTNPQGCFGVKNTYMFDEIWKDVRPGKYLIRVEKKSHFQNKVRRNNNPIISKIVVTAPQKVKFDYKSISEYQKMFQQFLADEGKTKLSQKNRQVRKMKNDIDYIVYWVGDLVVVYVEKTTSVKDKIKVEVHFPQLHNLECVSHSISTDYAALQPFDDYLLIVFEKKILTQETYLHEYTIEAF